MVLPKENKMDQRPERTPHQRRQLANKRLQRGSTSYAIRETQIKTAMTHLLGWPRSRNWQNQMLAARRNESSYSLLIRVWHGAAAVEGGLVVSYKANHPLLIRTTNWVPWYLLKGVENLGPHTNLHRVYSSLFIIAKDGVQPRCPSVGEGTNKLWKSRQWNSM